MAAHHHHQQQGGYQAAPTPSPIGGRSFIDHAKLRILLAPVGGVSETDFAKWCDYVRSFETVRLADLPSSCSARRRAAAAAAASTTGSSTPSGSSSSSSSPILQTGEIHLSFVTSYDPDHAFLAPFNMHRQVLGALGIATCSNNMLHRHELETSASALRELHPGALVHRVFGFDSGAKRPETVDLSSIKDVLAAKINAGQRSPSPLSGTSRPATAEGDVASGTAANASASPKVPASPDAAGFSAQRDGGLIIFPAVRKDGKDVRFYLKTLLAELVANILDGLDHIVTGLEGTPLETPRETLDGITTNRYSTASAASSASTGSWLSKTSTAAGFGAAASRASSLFTAFSSSGDAGTGTSTPTSSRPSSAVGGGSHPFDLGSPTSTTSSPTSENTTRSKILAANANKKSAKRITSAAGTGPTGTGRYTKVKADLHLLSGNLWDALEGYSVALTALGKERALAGGQDAVWFASALEGFSVARVLVSRMGGVVLEKAPCFDLPWSTTTAKEKEKEKDKDGIARPYAKQSWGEIAEAYTIAVVIYSKCLAPPSVLLEPVRSVTNDSPRDYTHPLIHASACTQYARFLLAVWASGGWNGECFDQLVYGGVPPALAEEKPTNAMYLSLTSMSGIARHDIAAAASSALSHSIIALKPTDQITLLGTLTAIFGCIGFSRREAHLLRQLQSTIVNLLVKAKRVNAKPPTTASLPILEQNQFGKDAEELVGNIVAQTTYDSLGRGPEAVLVLAMQICETYGIHVEVDPLCNIPPYHILSKASEGLRSAYASPALGGSEEWRQSNKSSEAPEVALLTPLEMAQEAPFGWTEQQILLLKESISIAELLSDYVGMAFFSAILLRDFHALLEPEEQRDLMIGMQRSIQAARWAGAQDLSVKYWGPPEPLCSLELLPLTPEKMPLEKDGKLLLPASSSVKGEEGVAGLNNPFFWNPAGITGGKAKAVAVQGEPLHVMATLQNPFAVELHIDTIALVGEGAGFIPTEAERVSIPPYSFQTVRLSGVAKETGKVTIKGINLALAGGCTETQTFLLPIYDEENAKQRRKQAAELDDRKTRLKVAGLDARSSVIKQRSPSTISGGSDVGKGKWLEVNVVPAQPTLSAFCAELEPMQAVDLYEGELVTLHLELQNISPSLEVNFIHLSFTDDVSDSAKHALSSGELLPQDVHEIEWDLVHQPVLSQPGNLPASGVRIEPGASKTFLIQVRGKIGCTSAGISVEYGNVDWDRLHSGVGTDAGTKVNMRKVELGFRMTVHEVVVCRGLRVGPVKAGEAARLTKEVLASGDSIPALLKTFGKKYTRLDVVRASEEEEGGMKEVKVIEPEVEPEADDEEYSLLTLDLSNQHREDVLLRISLNTGGVVPLHLYKVLRAGASTRVALPQPRIELDPATGKTFLPSSSSSSIEGKGATFPPIPSIWAEGSNRQFIVSKIQLAKSEELETRKNFWYREAVFSRLSGSWRTLPSSSSCYTFGFQDSAFGEGEDVVRTGELPLRGLVSSGGLILDPTSQKHLEKDPIRLRLFFNESEQGGAVHAESFITVTAHLTNRLSRPIKPLIRLVPTWSSSGGPPDAALLENVLLSDGSFAASTSRGRGGREQVMSRGEEKTVEWGVTFLSPGVYGFLVLVEEPLAATEDSREESAERLVFVSSVHSVNVLPSL
ncbi:related to hypercellular protein (hypa) [Ustilago trichophora]|uniref:Related to hypercellular protein (Hypa) n=1 Tax=Ustilago trichophora TaxID=86804 RepID=A0A5C3EFC4_9BASI|nr:related to hypercellular protein (hypa) [Ustilago trichophora]